MKVLIACEESQEVCKAFRSKGHEAYSCDIQECSGGHPEWHIQGDVLKILEPKNYWDGSPRDYIMFSTMDGKYHFVDNGWDLIIAHPPCTFLSNAGAARLYPKKGVINQDRYEKGLQAKEFFMEFYNADCDKICVENPIPTKIFGLPPYTQTIQPYEHGHPYSKKLVFGLKD